MGSRGGKTRRTEDVVRVSAHGYSVDTGVTARLLAVEPVGQRLENWCWAASTEMMLRYLRSLSGTECGVCGNGNEETDISQGRQMNYRLGDPAVDCSVERTEDFDYDACDRGGWPYFFEFEPRVESTKWAARRHVLEERGLVLCDGGPRVRVRRPLSDWELRALTHGSGPEFKRRLDDAEGCALSWQTLTELIDSRRPIAFSYRFRDPAGGHMRLAAGYIETPDAGRWVVVCDPLPPGTGELHLIPYEYYVNGPAGGHWRDYWVAPAGVHPARSAARGRDDGLRVGRGLVASYTNDEKTKWPGKGEYRLLAGDRGRAYRAAQDGLDVVEAIAIDAEPLALALGMGGNFLQVFGQTLLAFLQDPDGVHPARPENQPDIHDVVTDELELADQPIPVYELWRRDLKKWDGEDIKALLRRPREIIYQVTRERLRPFTFFAAVTVRREKDEWKLASLGGARLMATLALRQLGDWFVKRLMTTDAPLTQEQLIEHLWKLGLLNPILRGMSEEELRRAAADLGYSAAEIAGFLDGGEIRDIDGLCARARELDHKQAEEERRAAREELRLALGRETLAEGKSHREIDWMPRKTQKSAAGLRKLLAKAREASRGDDESLLEQYDEALDETSRALLRGGAGKRKALARIWSDGLDEESDTKLQRLLERQAEIEELQKRAPLADDELDRLVDLERRQETCWIDLRTQAVNASSGRLENWCERAEPTPEDSQRRMEELAGLKGEWERLRAEKRFTQAQETRRRMERLWRGLHPMIPHLSRAAAARARQRRLSLRRPELELPRIEIENPRYMIHVPSLYQRLVAYPEAGKTDDQPEPGLDDKVTPVYSQSFHRPEKQVEEGTLRQVLLDLRDIARRD